MLWISRAIMFFFIGLGGETHIVPIQYKTPRFSILFKDLLYTYIAFTLLAKAYKGIC